MADSRSRKRKAYTVEQALLIGSHALQEMERILLSDADNNEKIRSANAISTLINSYRRLVETSEIVERIEALENNKLRKVS